MTRRKPSIFLSHSSSDKFFVRKLATRFSEAGVKVWLDEAELRIGDSLIDKIQRAIEEMDYVGVVLSYESADSEWVQKELRTALDRELRERRVVVLPLRLDPVEIPGFLKEKVYADFTDPEKFEESFQRLLGSMDVRVTAEEKAKVSTEERAEVRAVGAEVKATEAGQRLAAFEDIKIEELDTSRSYNPNKAKKLWNMYLRLSSSPPAEWQQIFEAERKFPRHTMWRRAWIEGQFVVVYCVPQELEDYHLADLKRDVSESNKKYRDYITEVAQREAAEAKERADQAGALRGLRDRLNFD